MRRPSHVSKDVWDATKPVMRWVDAFWADELTNSEKGEARGVIAAAIQAERERIAAYVERLGTREGNPMSFSSHPAASETAAAIRNGAAR